MKEGGEEEGVKSKNKNRRVETTRGECKEEGWNEDKI
jgi:hypothetical protein